MFDLLVISLFVSMVLAPCVAAPVSTHCEGKAWSLARKAGTSSGEAKV